jgi:hypothetical protein
VNKNTRRIINQVERIKDFYDVGPVQRASVEWLIDLIIDECVKSAAQHEDLESFGVYPLRVAMVTAACQKNIREHFSE